MKIKLSLILTAFTLLIFASGCGHWRHKGCSDRSKCEHSQSCKSGDKQKCSSADKKQCSSCDSKKCDHDKKTCPKCKAGTCDHDKKCSMCKDGKCEHGVDKAKCSKCGQDCKCPDCKCEAGKAKPSSQHRHKGPMNHSFADAAKWAKVFDDPKRDAWQKPDQVVKWMNVKPGMKVADVGAGTGYFLPHLDKAVGKKGQVLAVDIEPNLIQHMETRIQNQKLNQTKALLAKANDPGLEKKSMDRILIVDTWHHIGDRGAYAKHLAKALKKNGKIYVVDFEPGKTAVGPDNKHRFPAQQVIAELASAGLHAKTVSVEDLPYQYIVVAGPNL